ncbi:MAG: M20/M25/M40 family metallo-hydrolase, partial [Candidatus Limnocylindrales bacterium]
MDPRPTDIELTHLHDMVAADEPAFLADLERLVDIDCGSYTKAGVDEVGRWVAGYLEGVGAAVRVHRHGTLGDTIVGTLDGTPGGPRLLLIGHMDTVFDPGTVAARPFRIEAGRAYGPGVSDMKGGLLTGLHALAALRHAEGPLPFERLTFIANPDEEIGSPMSTPIIRAAAAETDLCLVLECARANGDIVSSRKGILDARLTVHGRAAHAGVEPEKGRSAILAAAHLVPALHALSGRWPGVTCNVGVLHGGTRPNVVAEEATLEVDLRA